MSKLSETFLVDTSSLFLTSTNESKTIRNLALLSSIVVLLSICGFFNLSSDSLYYGCLTINFAYLLFNNGAKLNQGFLFLYCVLFINVIVVDIPDFFKPQMRLGLFLLMTATSASLFDGQNAVNFRRYIFKYVVYGLSVLAIGSFFAFFMGVNLMNRGFLDTSDFSTYSTTGGWFGGLTKHSMILGPISMIAALFFFTIYIEKHKNLYLILFFTCAMSAVMASSRAAVLGVVVALLYSLFMMRIAAFMRQRIVVLIMMCGLGTLPIFDIVFAGIMNKQQTRMETTESLNSRQDKFDYRIAEFESAPILGVGFCAIDINSGDGYGDKDGRIEPGTSHLAVLSMTGLIGMLAYLIILYQAYHNAKETDSPHARFALLCFIAMFVHAWFEGYVYSAGGFLSFLYWLIVGQCIDCTRVESN